MQVVGQAWMFGPDGRKSIPYLSEELDMTKSFSQLSDTVLGIVATQTTGQFYEKQTAILFPRQGRDKPGDRLSVLCRIEEIVKHQNEESIKRANVLARPPKRISLTVFYMPCVTGTNGEIARFIALYQKLGVYCELKEISRVHDHYVYEFGTEAK